MKLRKSRKVAYTTTLLLLAGAGAPGYALAQQAASVTTAESASGMLDTVVVTARRREENVQSVPLSVTVMSQAALVQQNVTTLFDIGRVAPGVTITATGNGTTRPAYQIRGQRAAATDISTDPSVAIYFAEVGQARPAGTPQSIFDLQSVQVLRGPQGTLFGRNTTGGIIMLTPNAPKAELGGYLLGNLGNFDLRTLEGVLNVPVSDKLAVRLSGRVNKRDGYFRNVLNGDRTWDENSQSYRAFLRFTPTDTITSDVIATYFHSDVKGYQPKLTIATAPAFQAELARSLAVGYYEYRENVALKPLGKDTVWGVQNTTSIEVGDMLLKNIIAYRSIVNHNAALVDGSALGIFNTLGNYDGDQISNELQLQGEVGDVKFVVGAFYFREAGTEYTKVGNPTTTFREFDGRNSSAAVFGHVDWQISEPLTLSAGLRYTHDDRKINSHTRIITARGVVCRPSADPAFDYLIGGVDDYANCSIVTKLKADKPTWDLTLNYQMTPDQLFYIAHRHGYRAGAAKSALNFAPVREETVNDAEVGSKSDFEIAGSRARFNIAGYYSDYRNMQRQIVFPVPGGAASGVVNAGKAHIYGFEAEFSAQVTHRLDVYSSFALTKAKYDRFIHTIRVATATPQFAAGTLVDVNNTTAIFSYTPERMLNVGATYVLPLSDDLGRASVSVNYAYQSAFQTIDTNAVSCGPDNIELWCRNATGLLPGYGLVNLRADWRRPFGTPVDVGFFVTNLAKKRYQAGASPLMDSVGFQSSWPGAPRMFGFELKVPFGSES